MNTRTCPNCNYKHNAGAYLKRIIFNITNTSWQCEKCNITLTINPKRRIRNSLLVAFGGLFVGLMLTQIWPTFDSYLIFVVSLMLLCATIIFLFDTFMVKE